MLLISRDGMCESAYSLVVTRASEAPEVLGSTLRGSKFQAKVKKIPSLALCAKALVVSRPQVGLRTLTWPRQVIPRVTSPSVRAGPGFGDFLGRRSRVFS